MGLTEFLKDLATFLTAVALIGFVLGLRWTPRAPEFRPKRWLLWMNIGGLALLLAFDVLELFWLGETHIALILGRRVAYRYWMATTAIGFLVIYARVLKDLTDGAQKS